MSDILEIALSANSETSQIEFKLIFDPFSDGNWCEIIKDIVAISNSGGGVIIFGLDSHGIPKGENISQLYSIDPSQITNKISKYTGYHFSEFSLHECEKQGNKLFAILIFNTRMPIIFEKPGTYADFQGKQTTAFKQGTLYFRHGPASEPGNNNDLRIFIEKRIEDTRNEWLKNVKQIIEAPLGTSFIPYNPNDFLNESQDGPTQTIKFSESTNGFPVYIKEEDIQKIYPLSYSELTSLLQKRYSNFLRNKQYHEIRKSLETDSKFCTVKYLDIHHPLSGSKKFYKYAICNEFDKFYELKES
jgi:hypothetical protein